MRTVAIEPTENRIIKVESDSQYVILRDPTKIKFDSFLQFDFVKEGVSAEVLFIDRLTESSEFSLVTIVNHIVPHTSCVTNIKTVLGDNAHFNYTGKILISKEAQQTSSFLNDHVLVIGKNTKHNTQPILQIDANDVQASHGSTTGTVDEAQIFYLTSRGLSDSEAKNLIVEGFLTELIAKISDENIREKLLIKVKS